MSTVPTQGAAPGGAVTRSPNDRGSFLKPGSESTGGGPNTVKG